MFVFTILFFFVPAIAKRILRSKHCKAHEKLKYISSNDVYKPVAYRQRWVVSRDIRKAHCADLVCRSGGEQTTRVVFERHVYTLYF